MKWPFGTHRTPPDAEQLDQVIAASVGLARRLGPVEADRLVELTAEMLSTKRWEAVQGFALTDEMRIVVAANAAIPILNLDLAQYRTVHSIIIRESTARSSGLRSGPMAGVVIDEPTDIVGLATPESGPISISWDAALAQSLRPEDGRNVVIHEFAHKIDMSDGYSDGTPPLRGEQLERWTAVLVDEYEHAKVRPSDAALRPYAWTNRAEFFAVASEAFFCTPKRLADAKPALYEALVGFYRRDPRTT